jgi:hypothetical protein
MEEVIAERRDTLTLADDVLNKWLSVLEIDCESGEDM